MLDVECQANGQFTFIQDLTANDEAPFLKQCFRPFFVLLRFVGLYLPSSRLVHRNRKNSASFCAGLRLIIIAVLFLLSVYRLIRFGLHISISIHKISLPSTTMLVMFTWSLQSAISIIFVAYWQYYGYLDSYFNLLHRAQRSVACKNSRRRIYGRFAACLVFCLLGTACSLGIALVGFLVGGEQVAISESIYYMFGPRSFYWIAIGVMCYATIAWFAAITIYSNCINGALIEVRHMNEQLAKIGDDGQPTADNLLKFFVTHSELVSAIKQLDNTFEAYAFLMFGTNMPTTILSVYILLSNVHLPCAALAGTAAGVFFSLMQLWALSVTPARLHEAIHKAQEILYAEISIWYPYQENVSPKIFIIVGSRLIFAFQLYRIANTFVAHIGQTYLGISIWGFALITKPLILTTISLTITYLTFMLQLKPFDEDDVDAVLLQNKTI